MAKNSGSNPESAIKIPQTQTSDFNPKSSRRRSPFNKIQLKLYQNAILLQRFFGWRTRGLKDQLGQFHRELSKEHRPIAVVLHSLFIETSAPPVERKIKIIFPFCGERKNRSSPLPSRVRGPPHLIRLFFYCRGKRLYYCESHAGIIARWSRAENCQYSNLLRSICTAVYAPSH